MSNIPLIVIIGGLCGAWAAISLIPPILRHRQRNKSWYAYNKTGVINGGVYKPAETSFIFTGLSITPIYQQSECWLQVNVDGQLYWLQTTQAYYCHCQHGWQIAVTLYINTMTSERRISWPTSRY